MGVLRVEWMWKDDDKVMIESRMKTRHMSASIVIPLVIL